MLSVHAIGGMQLHPIAPSFYPIAISNRLSLHPIARAFVSASVDRSKFPLIAYGSPLIADNASDIAGRLPRIADHRITLQQTPFPLHIVASHRIKRYCHCVLSHLIATIIASHCKKHLSYRSDIMNPSRMVDEEFGCAIELVDCAMRCDEEFGCAMGESAVR